MEELHTGAKAKRSDKENQNLWLNITIAVGAVIIFIFGFCVHLLNSLLLSYGWRLLEHWESWELGALLWTALFVVYYFVTLKLTRKDGPDKTIMLFLLLIVIFTVIAWTSLLYWHAPLQWPAPYVHVLSVTGIGTFLMLTDRLLAKHHRLKQDRRAFLESYLLSGVPMVTAYAILFAYAVTDGLVHKALLHSDIENKEIFFSGAISFQLLVSNVIFVLVQKGVIPNVVAAKAQTRPQKNRKRDMGEASE